MVDCNLSLPCSSTISSDDTAFQITNNGNGTAIWGESVGGEGYGVYGRNDKTVGVIGVSENIAVSGTAVSGNGGIGVAGFGGDPNDSTSRGVYGECGSGHAVHANSNNGGIGVYAITNGSAAIVGESTGIDGNGVAGIANNGGGAYGVWGWSTNGYAGYFSGDVEVLGTITGNKAFKIDHPLDPAKKYLYHASVESPDMKNIYDGVAVLDAKGEAVIELPEWFEALNKDFRYQLTCVGGYAQIYVAREIEGNCFTIAGGTPGMKISWQVTGIRQDAWANANRIPIEEEKPEREHGYYLHPLSHNQTAERGIEWVYKPEHMRQLMEGSRIEPPIPPPIPPLL